MELMEAVKLLRLGMSETQQSFATRLGISIRGLVNYEKTREPPLPLLLKLGALAHEVDEEHLADVFESAFYKQISDAIRGHRIAFLRDAGTSDEETGFMMMNFGPGHIEQVSAFMLALGQVEQAEDSSLRRDMEQALKALRAAVMRGKKTAAGKKTG
jgi:transcriptional regulator with XRE-family HTH domain